MSDDRQESSIDRQDASQAASGETSAAGTPLADQPTVVSGRRAAPSGSNHLLDPGSLVRGEELDHFQLQEYIGVGGMGTVFRAWDTRLQRPVALKVLPREQAVDSETTQRFIHEARSAARLNHENIARVYFVGEARGLHYIAFEFVEGTDVRKLIAQFGRLAVNDAVSTAIQIAGALKHASVRDVVHRDIKPSNIVVTREGLAKLVDMGLARNYDTHGGLTASGVTLGTFDYLSPEQAHDPRTADVRSDIYSLGCTLYHMLTGQPPYVEGNALQKMLQHREAPPPDPRDLNPDVPDALANIVLRMMRKKPKDRYQSANELLHDLTALAGGMGLHSTSPEGLIWMAPGSVPVPAWQRHAIWMVPVLGVLLIVVVAGLLMRQGADARETMQSGPRTVAEAPRVAELPETPQGEESSSPDAVPPREAIRSPLESEGATSPLANVTEPDGQDPTSGRAPETQESEDRQADSTVAAEQTEQPSDQQGEPSGQGVRATEPKDRTVTDRGRTGVEATVPQETEPAADQRPSQPIPSDTNREGPPSVRPDAVSVPGDLAADERPPATSRALVVDPDGEKGTFDSLKVAVSHAMKGAGSVIELRFNGPLRQGPLPVSGLKRLTIRAAEGYHPTLVLDLRGVDADEPVHFISFIDGTLDLIGLHLVLEVPSNGASDSWAMVSVKDARRLHVQDCVFTLRNPVGRSVAFLEGRWSWDDQAAMGAAAAVPQEPTELEVERCFFRGDGDVVMLREPKDVVRVTLGDNNLIATNRRLLSVTSHGMSEPRVEVAITHVTARVDEGLLRVDTAGGAKPSVEVRAEDSILIVSAQAAMISHVGDIPVNDFRDSFQWQAHRNFYEGVETFWSIESTSRPAMPIRATAEQFDFAYWQDYWGIDQESEPEVDEVVWENRLDRLTPTWLLQRDEFRLSERRANRAIGSAPDRGDAGAKLTLVPTPQSQFGERQGRGESDTP